MYRVHLRLKISSMQRRTVHTNFVMHDEHAYGKLNFLNYYVTGSLKTRKAVLDRFVRCLTMYNNLDIIVGKVLYHSIQISDFYVSIQQASLIINGIGIDWRVNPILTNEGRRLVQIKDFDMYNTIDRLKDM